jgi:7,8-dihydropterin-6-yl-methyl-4-(beta-D-ribofuranosyl)aminobenzene 5'-phosphate synthase
MSKKVNRREFLEVSAATGALFLAEGLWWGRATAQGAVAIPEAERIVVTVITDNLADATRPNVKIARRPARTTNVLDGAMHGEHGLAYHVETVVGGQAHVLLFDFGSQAVGVLRNIELLGLDLHKVEALALSHDHWDHEAALLELLQAKRAAWRPDLPFYVGEKFFVGTYSKRPTGQIQTLSILNRAELEGLGLVKLVEVTTPTSLVPGAWFTGRVERVTDYETIPPTFLEKKGDQYVQEEFIGEQAVVMNAKGKGLVVLAACAHRGIVNTLKHAQKMTGIEKVHAVIGGFHLTGARPEVIAKTIADVKAMRPDYIVPTHCTGFEAITAFAREMPEQFILNTAGTKYFIEA